jgi:hypothetical protein
LAGGERPVSDDARSNQLRDALEERTVFLTERRRPIGVDVDLADDPALARDRDDDLGARGGEAREVARVGVHVVDDLGDAACSGRAADALPDRDPHVLGRLRPLPRAEHEVVAFDDVDPDPRVVVESFLEHFDRRGERVLRAGDRRECFVVRHRSRSAPSKAAIGSIMSSGIG